MTKGHIYSFVLLNNYTTNSSSFARIEPENVLLLALKRAEDGRGMIVRLMETGGRDVEAAISLPFLKFSGAALANLVEEDQSPLVASAGTVTVPVRAWGTATVRLF